MRNSLTLQVLTPYALDSADAGTTILGRLEQHGLTPERIGNYEPMRTEYDLERALELWGDSFLWKRKRRSVEGSVWMPLPVNKRHACICATSIDLRVADNFLGLFRDLIVDTRADFGLIQQLVEQDVAHSQASMVGGWLDTAHRQFHLSVTTHDLRWWIPEFYWATVLGPPYVEMIGRDKVLSTPAAIVEEVAENTIYLQLTDSLDISEDYPKYAELRSAAKEHLGLEFFFEMTDEDKKRVPDFAFHKPWK